MSAACDLVFCVAVTLFTFLAHRPTHPTIYLFSFFTFFVWMVKTQDNHIQYPSDVISAFPLLYSSGLAPHVYRLVWRWSSWVISWCMSTDVTSRSMSSVYWQVSYFLSSPSSPLRVCIVLYVIFVQIWYIILNGGVWTMKKKVTARSRNI